MGIRTYSKDHLRELSPGPEVAAAPRKNEEPVSADPLVFWTKGTDETDATQVDLRPFRDGYLTPTKKGQGATAFAGRPRLIEQLAPAFKVFVECLAPLTVNNYVKSLRNWWRLLDDVETVASRSGVPMRVSTVADLTELHRQRAHDTGIDRVGFGIFVRIVNAVRAVNALPQLYWAAPEEPDPKRHLLPQWQIDEIRFALKRGWFAALDRWERADQLLAGDAPTDEREAGLLQNYLRFKSIVAECGVPRPSLLELQGGLASSQFYAQGFNVGDMVRGSYPDALDIRAAFHLCLASTGWNVAVLLSLDATKDFLEPHPKDATRYLMHGYKARGRSEQMTEGLFKSQGSAGVVLQALLRRTKPLRDHLRLELDERKAAYERMFAEGADESVLSAARKEVVELEQGVRSPWLHVGRNSPGVKWLNAKNYTHSLDKGASYLENLVAGLSEGRPEGRRIGLLTAGDFRDAFAAYAYRVSGGMVLYVMRALGHRRPKTTGTYLDNTLLNEESDRLYRTFSTAFWREVEARGAVDATVIAKWCRDGAVSDEERERLAEYRTLQRSRIGVGCREPTNPPKRIAPWFKVDGKSMCPVHRCTLCFENAVIFPDSLGGLAQRYAELLHIRSGMSLASFIESSFGEELENTELALAYFDQGLVQDSVAQWQRRIESGEHRVVAFDGM